MEVNSGKRYLWWSCCIWRFNAIFSTESQHFTLIVIQQLLLILYLFASKCTQSLCIVGKLWNVIIKHLGFSHVYISKVLVTLMYMTLYQVGRGSLHITYFWIYCIMVMRQSVKLTGAIWLYVIVFLFYYMTIIFDLMLLLVTLIVTTITSMYDLTLLLFTWGWPESSPQQDSDPGHQHERQMTKQLSYTSPYL